MEDQTGYTVIRVHLLVLTLPHLVPSAVMTPVRELSQFQLYLSMAMYIRKVEVGFSILSSHPNPNLKTEGGERSKEGGDREEDEEEKEEEEEKEGKEDNGVMPPSKTTNICSVQPLRPLPYSRGVQRCLKTHANIPRRLVQK